MNKRQRKKRSRIKIVTFTKDGNTKEKFYRPNRDKLKVGQKFTIQEITNLRYKK